MIVDCHTHIWQSVEQLGQLDMGDPARPSKRPLRFTPSGKSPWRSLPAGDPDSHWAQSRVVDKAIVLGFKSKYLQAEIPNSYVAEYVNRFPQKLIGFAGIDPTERTAVEEVKIAKNDLHQGVRAHHSCARSLHHGDVDTRLIKSGTDVMGGVV